MSQRRLSIRAVALKYGLPTRAVARAVASGDLPAALTLTETGRTRAYISPEDADLWFQSLNAAAQPVAMAGGSR
jgi:hypothetical protein